MCSIAKSVLLGTAVGVEGQVEGQVGVVEVGVVEVGVVEVGVVEVGVVEVVGGVVGQVISA